ncbi:hypothetical protein D3C80_1183900 [compost metagenome]
MKTEVPINPAAGLKVIVLSGLSIAVPSAADGGVEITKVFTLALFTSLLSGFILTATSFVVVT